MKAKKFGISQFVFSHRYDAMKQTLEMALPESSVYDHYKHCDSQGIEVLKLFLLLDTGQSYISQVL